MPYPKRSERPMNFFKIIPEAATQAQRLAQLHDEARAQARLLCAQAIDDFWHGVSDWLRSTRANTYASTRRSTQRMGDALALQRAGRQSNRYVPVSTSKLI